MFIGHYAAAFAARAVRPAVPLGMLFVAVQLVDFAWAGLLLAGIEKVRIVPGFMEASALDLYYMPYSHGLLATVIWTGAAGGLYAVMRAGAPAWRAGAIFGAAVASHWLLDFVVHAPDLPVIVGEPKLGLGLWRSLLWSTVLEVGLLAVGFIVYLRATRPRGAAGRAAPWLFLAGMLALQAYNHVAPPPPDAATLAVTAVLAFSVLALGAWAVDRLREPKTR